MKKHELLKHAYDNYPKGTKFKQLASNMEIISSGEFEVYKDYINHVGSDDFVYNNGKWAEIVKSKVAVKVENEKEFNALMKYYDSLCFTWRMGEKATEHILDENFPLSIGVENANKIMLYIGEFKDVERIPFSDFAKEHNIKLPLLKSEDGVWLYEGDKFYSVNKKELLLDSKIRVITKDCILNTINYTFFHFEKSALKWVADEKNKITKKYICFNNNIHIYNRYICVQNGNTITTITLEQLEDIIEISKELS